MNYDFANGTARQDELWAEAAHHLLNMPFDSIGLDVAVEFVDPDEVVAKGHTDLAITTFTYGSTSATTIVRDDAPDFGSQRPALEAGAAAWGLPYDPVKFYMETAIHELGHAAFAALSQQNRLAVVRLFGVNTDDLAVLAPEGAAWEDRIIEGIAETYKEAFLPGRFRLFPNRTRRRLPYGLYPMFRAIFRRGGGVGATGGPFDYVYGGDYPWRVDLNEWGIGLPAYEGENDDKAFVFYEEIEGYRECFGVDMSQFKESTHKPFTIRPAKGITT